MTDTLIVKANTLTENTKQTLDQPSKEDVLAKLIVLKKHTLLIKDKEKTNFLRLIAKVLKKSADT